MYDNVIVFLSKKKEKGQNNYLSYLALRELGLNFLAISGSLGPENSLNCWTMLVLSSTELLLPFISGLALFQDISKNIKKCQDILIYVL